MTIYKEEFGLRREGFPEEVKVELNFEKHFPRLPAAAVAIMNRKYRCLFVECLSNQL